MSLSTVSGSVYTWVDPLITTKQYFLLALSSLLIQIYTWFLPLDKFYTCKWRYVSNRYQPHINGVISQLINIDDQDFAL